MRFDASQQMRMGQQMRLAPRMIQSMEILQMPILQLEERIAQELESNVTIEAVEGEEAFDPAAPGSAIPIEGAAAVEARQARLDDIAPDAAQVPLRVDHEHGTDDFARLDSFEHENPDLAVNEFNEDHVASSEIREYEYQPSRVASGDEDAKSAALNNTESRGASIQDQLREQWHLSDVQGRVRVLGDSIIAYVEDDGYLRTPLAAIIDRWPGVESDGTLRPSLDELEKALRIVQLVLDPPGVAARDTRECLLLQLDAIIDEHRSETPEDRQIWDLTRRLIEHHIDDLAQNRLPKIADATGQTLDRIKKAMEKMKLLNLAPGRQLVDEPVGQIVPDAIVEFDQDQDRYIVYMNDRRLPNLRINREYALMAKDKEAPKPTREFIKKNLSNAQWLIEAVQQRKRTLERVIRVVVDAQREYFDFGPQSLKPLPMTQVADQLGVHVATVSRAVAEKYIQTPRGVVPLRGFFSGGTQTQSGEDVSWDAIKAAMQEVIDAEEKTSPLSDDAIAEALKSRGIEIARRTVAKYRDQLGIPSARLRKTF